MMSYKKLIILKNEIDISFKLMKIKKDESKIWQKYTLARNVKSFFLPDNFQVLHKKCSVDLQK